MESELSRHLTRAERKALKKRYKERFSERELTARAEPKHPRRPESNPIKKKVPVVRLASGFPPKFVSETLAANQCAPLKKVHIGQADVTFDQLGRPTKVSWRRSSSPECIDAMTTLFAASLASPDLTTDPAIPHTLFMVLEDGYLSRLETSASDTDTQYMSIEDAESIKPPERTRFIKPEYPVSMRARRSEGKAIYEIVVDREGFVSDMHLLKEADEEFVAAGFRSVARWRYKPATLSGKPVKVYLTVIVEWDVR